MIDHPTYAVDIGSTLIKIAGITGTSARSYHLRTNNNPLSRHVSNIIDEIQAAEPEAKFRICSSANGGLRVGILCLSMRFSGRATAKLATLAGANVVYVHAMRDIDQLPSATIDFLIVTGGIDCHDTTAIQRHLQRFDFSAVPATGIIYAGNQQLASWFQAAYRGAITVANPVDDSLAIDDDTLANTLRNAYLDDIIHKDGVSSLQSRSEVPIWPTPAVVNQGFKAVARQQAAGVYPVPLILIDIGGATTDLHYGVELLPDDSESRVDDYAADHRHVFTDLGVATSRANTVARLVDHPRLFAFLAAVDPSAARQLYDLAHQGTIADELLFYACFFLALDAVGVGHDGTAPRLRVEKASAIVVTGGASQAIDISRANRIAALLAADGAHQPAVILDEDYSIWTVGMRKLTTASPA